MASGIYSELEELLSIRFHVKQRRLTQQQKLISEKAVITKRSEKGAAWNSAKYANTRQGMTYATSTGKSVPHPKTHTKLFTEELERPIVCVTEQTPKLFFGSQVRFKSAQALNIMAALGWTTLQQGDRFGA